MQVRQGVKKFWLPCFYYETMDKAKTADYAVQSNSSLTPLRHKQVCLCETVLRRGNPGPRLNCILYSIDCHAIFEYKNYSQRRVKKDMRRGGVSEELPVQNLTFNVKYGILI
ncbi:MAG: hypothetical protein UR66_C0001G0089 [Candidatus Moranbacteria bacterium GW2011_GWE1_35_17]|nr:MAG: hypothetical protein UR66_C0001G0089 [Candidatus Moranbacteria bacterium GW2011_GWE1_35_17]KKP72754.1 MAG: hypothetical protein UR65_C0012G0019 [Candidatus Moranbacteria bacterium GW2011_GWE2_35_164]KKP81152.1 MAG: hypothetical protein UR82_C0071G0012 [Candidatus Moranbacteria bacterium GW2011_GWF1_35_5]KKP85192.1 MAG: hypothetical protein UR83_C0003G0027 [Candidatus Moranbacteria bacterium GW2011_GWF2_35_54]